MNHPATTSPNRGHNTGIWAHGITAIAQHAQAHRLPYPMAVDTGQHPSGQMVVTLRLYGPDALTEWLDTVQLVEENTEYRHPEGLDPHLRVYAQVRLPDSGVVVILSGVRPYDRALELVKPR